jgi:methionyl-tRNA formyltransferase
LRIALIGQAAFAEKALVALNSHGEEIVHVFAPPDAPGGRPDALKAKAAELKLPTSQPKSFRGDEAFAHFASLSADLAILAFVTLIVPEPILYAPRLKSICFHPSLLPRHRGASAINWAIIQGDRETGVTWFWPDKGIDTGPILIQRRVPIEENDTTGSIYFNRLFPLGIETLIEAVDLIKAGRAPAIPQDERIATYDPPCRDEHGRVDFSRAAREVYNLVRGCDPQPGAWAESGGRRLRLYEPAFDPREAHAEPGAIVSIDSDGMRVALRGATMIVRRVRFDPDPKKVAPQELAALGGLRAGSGLR